MSTHNICFHGEVRIVFIWIPLKIWGTDKAYKCPETWPVSSLEAKCQSNNDIKCSVRE